MAFRWLIDFFQTLFRRDFAGWLGNPYLIPVVVAVGVFIASFIITRWAEETRGAGVPEVMADVVTEGGAIRPRVIGIKALVSAITIGSGGSVGREGPIVQIGSALGSALGQLFRLSGERLKILVGCGAAAGISATFNAPIAGGLFALEVILGDFSVNTFSPILLSSILANATAAYAIGNEPAFTIPSYELASPFELGYFAVLAVIVGVASVGFSRFRYLMEDAFNRLTTSNYIKPIIGGLLVGIIGISYPQVFGVGYETLTDALLGRLDVTLILVLFLVKFLATSFTLAGGGSGGIFAPSLFMGAMIGGAYGHLVHLIAPGSTAAPGAYALVGMSAMVAGTTHAPLTAMVILFELTDDYHLILGLMLATIISTLVAKRIFRESIYSLKLSRRGLRISQGVDMSLLESIPVKEAMTTDYDFLRVQTPLGEIVSLLQHSELTDFPVVNDDSSLTGIVSFQDIRSVMMDEDLYPLLIAADVIGPDPPAVTEYAPLSEAMALFASGDITNLPVISDVASRRLVGVVTQTRMMGHYHQELQRRHRR